MDELITSQGSGGLMIMVGVMVLEPSSLMAKVLITSGAATEVISTFGEAILGNGE